MIVSLLSATEKFLTNKKEKATVSQHYLPINAVVTRCQSSRRRVSYTKLTKLWEDDEIFRVALRTQHLRGAVTALFLVDPALQAHLMNPTIGSAAPTWPYPQCIAVVFLRRKADPTRPVQMNSAPCVKRETRILPDGGSSFMPMETSSSPAKMFNVDTIQ